MSVHYCCSINVILTFVGSVIAREFFFSGGGGGGSVISRHDMPDYIHREHSLLPHGRWYVSDKFIPGVLSIFPWSCYKSCQYVVMWFAVTLLDEVVGDGLVCKGEDGTELDTFLFVFFEKKTKEKRELR